MYQDEENYIKSEFMKLYFPDLKNNFENNFEFLDFLLNLINYFVKENNL